MGARDGAAAWVSLSGYMVVKGGLCKGCNQVWLWDKPVLDVAKCNLYFDTDSVYLWLSIDK